MKFLMDAFGSLPNLLPFLVTAAIVGLVLWLTDWLILRRRTDLGPEGRTPRQVLMLLLTVAGVIVVVIALPVGEATRGQMLAVVGLLLSAIIALSSTTFVTNALAGLMLRSVRSFRTGDFVRIGKHFGRVTERGLFHVEIQTEDRDLTTLPNLYLVTNPLTAIRESGTIISVQVSLGYDIGHSIVAPLLLRAARTVELREPFVQILKLDDFSVTYRIAGFLSDPRRMLTVRSRLYERVLDTLHAAGIEIVSPIFLNQRSLSRGDPVVPSGAFGSIESSDKFDTATPESLIFDKADVVERIEHLRAEKIETVSEIKELERRLKRTEDDGRPALSRELRRRQRRAEAIDAMMTAAEEAKDDVHP